MVTAASGAQFAGTYRKNKANSALQKGPTAGRQLHRACSTLRCKYRGRLSLGLGGRKAGGQGAAPEGGQGGREGGAHTAAKFSSLTCSQAAYEALSPRSLRMHTRQGRGTGMSASCRVLCHTNESSSLSSSYRMMYVTNTPLPSMTHRHCACSPAVRSSPGV